MEKPDSEGSAPMTSYIKKFNPYDLPEETLAAIATGRERVLGEILSIIASNAEGGRVQHLQVVAPRGYGKSFLMRMVQSALKVRVAEGLPAVLALLPEEQHNVDAPHRLLNEIQRLVEGRPAASLLGGAFEESDGAWEEAVAALDSAIAAKLPEGRGIAVTIVENFDQLISDVFRKPRDQSRLRALLDRPGGRLMLLATATRRADAAYEQRLFHATRWIELEPWQEEFCLTFFERLRGHRQLGPMSPQLQAKAKALAQFIGGSPRMATVLAEVLEHNDSLRVAQMLEALVDELTPYYKHRIESLSRRARTLLDALLRMGEPRTQSEIAARLGVVQSRIAEPFNELRAGGEVVGVKAQRSAEMLYRVSDRLMAYYYRKRHLGVGEGTSLLEGIVEFLESFFTLDEKRAEAERLRASGHPAEAAVFDRLIELSKTPSDGSQSVPGAGTDWLDDVRTQMVSLAKEGHLNEALMLCQQAVSRAQASGIQREVARSQRFLAWTLTKLRQYKEAEENVRQALAMAKQAGDLREQTKALLQLGWILHCLARHSEAEKEFGQALPLAQQLGDLQEQVEALHYRGSALRGLERHTEAEESLRSALALAEKLGNPEHISWTSVELLQLAQVTGNDARVAAEWLRAHRCVAEAPTTENLPDLSEWFPDAVAAALRSQQFGTFWSACTASPMFGSPIWSAGNAIAKSIAKVSQTRGRAEAYAMAAQCIEVLAQDAAVRSVPQGLIKDVLLNPVSMRRQILSALARQGTDPALLRDIVLLLEQRLPLETELERMLLEAAAQRAENPDDPAALERVDPDISTLMQLYRPTIPTKPLPSRSKRPGKSRGKE